MFSINRKHEIPFASYKQEEIHTPLNFFRMHLNTFTVHAFTYTQINLSLNLASLNQNYDCNYTHFSDWFGTLNWILIGTSNRPEKNELYTYLQSRKFCLNWARFSVSDLSRTACKEKKWPIVNPFLPTVPTFTGRETDVSRHNGGTSGVSLQPLRHDSVLRALSTLRGLRGAPEVPPLCRETQSLGQQMLKGPLGINGLI